MKGKHVPANPASVQEAPALPQAQAEGLPVDDDDEIDLKFKLHHDNPINFLKLGSALRLLMKRTISNVDVETADSLLREYCTELIWVRFPILPI